MNMPQSTIFVKNLTTKTTSVFGISIALLGTVSCSEVTTSDMLGKYVSQGECTGEEIILMDGGIFSHSYSSENYNGQWSIKGSRIDKSIAFSPFNLWKPDGEVSRKEISHFGTSVVKSMVGGITITINDDYNCLFRK